MRSSVIGLALIASSCSNRDAAVADSAAANDSAAARDSVTVGDSRIAEAAQPKWLVATNDDSAQITRSISRADLAKKFGAQNLRDDAIQIGEGDTKPGTIVYPDDSTRRFEIIWRDPKAAVGLESLRLTGSTSVWRIAPGISLGTSLTELESLNGRPFVLTGFNWDYAGTVLRWRGGKLEHLATGTPRVFVRLSPSYADDPRTEKNRGAVMGDHDFGSEIAPMQRLNPRVYQILADFTQMGAS